MSFSGLRKGPPPPYASAMPKGRSQSLMGKHAKWCDMLDGKDQDAENVFVYTFALTSDAAAAYKAAGYPLTDTRGNPIADSTLLRRARQLATLPRIKYAVEQLRHKITAVAAKEWSRDEVVDGYRKIYQVALDNLQTAVYNGSERYNDRAASTAVTILERITQLYGYNAPAKVDATVQFVFGGLGNDNEQADGDAQTYDYDGQDDPGESVNKPVDLSPYTV